MLTPAAPTEGDLAPSIQDTIVIDAQSLMDGSLTQGTSVTITGLIPGERYFAWFLSTPIATQWQTASAAGTITVTVPSSLSGAHRVAVQNGLGVIIGWANVTIEPTDAAAPPAQTTAAQQAQQAKKLSDTGANALPIGLLAGIFLVLGLSTLVLARRRKTTRA